MTADTPTRREGQRDGERFARRPGLPARRAVTSRDRELGSAELVSFLIVFPMLFFLLMFGVQAAVSAGANQVAARAAQEGARAARRDDGTADAGKAAANSVLAALAKDTLRNPIVSASRGQDTATVTITGQALSVIPGFSPSISQTSSGPVERFRSAGG